MEYKVERDHLGDKPYVKGEMRHAEPSDVAHLLRLGVLIEVKVNNPPKIKTNTPKTSKKNNPTPTKSTNNAPTILAKVSVKK